MRGLAPKGKNTHTAERGGAERPAACDLIRGNKTVFTLSNTALQHQENHVLLEMKNTTRLTKAVSLFNLHYMTTISIRRNKE